MHARSDEGPRADPTMDSRARGDIQNHVLLCGTCHDEVDKDEDGWPIERLRELRADHIEWIDEQLDGSGPSPADLLYAEKIDAAVELVHLDAWAAWTEPKFDPTRVWMPADMDNVAELRRRMFTTDWPSELPGLEVALLRLSWLLTEASVSFGDRAQLEPEGYLKVPRAYKQHGWNPNFHRDAQAFRDWQGEYEGMLMEATKAANWIRDEWRAAGNVEFLPSERPHLVTGPHLPDMRSHIHLPEYTKTEKNRLLKAGRAGIDDVPALRLDLRD
jgi:hypothetical protein